MDVAVNLVEAYLRLNGYLTLSEFEVQRKTDQGVYETLTDVDVVGLRFPGDVFAADAHDEDDCAMLLIEDEVLLLEPRTIDVVIGEVKQGEAVFNPGLKRHEVLHSVLRRMEWMYAERTDEIVEELQESGLSVARARSGDMIRTRLVAFGRSEVNDLNTISLTHIVRTMMRFMEEFEDILRVAQIKEPAPALLRLLAKIGFSVTKD